MRIEVLRTGRLVNLREPDFVRPAGERTKRVDAQVATAQEPVVLYCDSPEAAFLLHRSGTFARVGAKYVSPERRGIIPRMRETWKLFATFAAVAILATFFIPQTPLDAQAKGNTAPKNLKVLKPENYMEQML